MFVRVVRLDEPGLRGLDETERARALSMIGATFEVFEIDDHSHPCVMKEFPGETQDSAIFHSIALDSDEFEVDSAGQAGMNDRDLADKLLHDHFNEQDGARARGWVGAAVAGAHGPAGLAGALCNEGGPVGGEVETAGDVIRQVGILWALPFRVSDKPVDDEGPI